MWLKQYNFLAVLLLTINANGALWLLVKDLWLAGWDKGPLKYGPQSLARKGHLLLKV
jgi:hypothetical protein